MTAAAPAASKYRYKLGANISNSSSHAEADCALLASIGGRVARVSIEGSGAASTLAIYKKACDNHGLELLQCAQTPGHVVPRSQKDMDAYAMDVAHQSTVANRTSTGNEVNGFGSNETPNPKGQADIILACAAAVAKYAPGSRLATPSLCPAAGPLGSSYVAPLLFFDAMVNAQPSILRVPKIEVEWHGYGPFNMPIDTEQTWNTAWRTLALDQDLATMGFPNMRINWSEFGEPVGNGGGDAAYQAAQFDGYIGLIDKLRAGGVNFRELVWYQLRDDGQSGWPGTCGLFDIRGNAKPIVAHFTAAAKLAA